MKRPRNTPKAKRNASHFDRVTGDDGRKIPRRRAIERIETVEMNDEIRAAFLGGEWVESEDASPA